MSAELLPVRVRAGLRETWDARVRLWAELRALLRELDAAARTGWSLSRGCFRPHQWAEIARVRGMLRELPALRELIQNLGRLRSPERPDAPTVFERAVGSIRRVVPERVRARVGAVSVETRGIERSAELARMLPSEAVLLTHPVLRALWHARRAERALLTYGAEGVLTERGLVERDFAEDLGVPRPRAERGPIVLCLDTSGSMGGTPEAVAKAVVLQALCVAWSERRDCFVYSFSGPGDVEEHQLSFGADGLEVLLCFLARSFGGGTDLVEPLRRAAERLEDPAWAHADVLLVSDGQFEVGSEVVASVERARARHGVRVHGLLIGRDAHAMRSLCDPVHQFHDWVSLLSPAE